MVKDFQKREDAGDKLNCKYFSSKDELRLTVSVFLLHNLYCELVRDLKLHRKLYRELERTFIYMENFVRLWTSSEHLR